MSPVAGLGEALSARLARPVSTLWTMRSGNALGLATQTGLDVRLVSDGQPHPSFAELARHWAAS